MSIRKYLDTQPLYELMKYDKRPDLLKEAVPFTGVVRKHPYDPEKLLLVTEPFSTETGFYEFLIEDVISYEEMPSIATEEGESLFTMKLWVRKGSMGIQYHPFEVDDELRYLKDSEVLHQVMSEAEKEKEREA
jgi:inorganic pyrophosphatase